MHVDGSQAPLVISIGAVLLASLFAIVSWFVRDKVHSVERRLEQMELRTGGLEMSKAAAEVEMRQITALAGTLGELRSEIAIKFATRDDFAALQARLDQFADAMVKLQVSVASGGRTS